ncbi:MAG: RNA methyltransferase [Planctomycetota bacterium]
MAAALTPTRIQSPQNPRLKRVRRLRTRHGRKKEGAFLLEGSRAIRDALTDAPGAVSEVYLPEEALDPELLELAEAQGVAAFALPAPVFAELSQLEVPPGALAVASARYAELDALLGEDPGAPRAVVACLGVQDPGNLGSILRSAAFFGFAGLVLLRGGADPYHPRLVRASSGALLRSPPAQVADAAELLTRARARGYTPVACVAHGGAEPTSLPARCLLLLGAEGPGVPAELLGDCLPLTLGGHTESLNVAAAFAVSAHLWARGSA